MRYLGDSGIRYIMISSGIVGIKTVFVNTLQQVDVSVTYRTTNRFARQPKKMPGFVSATSLVS